MEANESGADYPAYPPASADVPGAPDGPASRVPDPAARERTRRARREAATELFLLVISVATVVAATLALTFAMQ